jgi:Ni/Fe-hydrogenase 1 B-type cytochrome subunit
MESGDQQDVTLVAKKVYDPFLRILHIWNGLCVFSLLLTIWLKGLIKDRFVNGLDFIYTYHVYIGYALCLGIFARFLWGFVGPKHAKFKNMFFLKDWIKLIKTRKISTENKWGHDKYASIAYLFFYLCMLYQCISGLILAARIFGMGPVSFIIQQSKGKSEMFHYLKEVHEIIFYISMIYIVLHVSMIRYHEIKEKYPIAQAIFSGWQYRKKS